MNALLRLFHRHRWHDTRINPYATATEQRCRCGEFRHHTSADLHGINMGDEPRWHAGRHPPNASGEGLMMIVCLAVVVAAVLASGGTMPPQRQED